MGNRPDGLVMSQARDGAAIHNLEGTSFDLYGGVGRLIENAPHVAVALRGSVVVAHTGTLFVARAGAHPRGEQLIAKSVSIKDAGGKSGGRVLKAIELFHERSAARLGFVTER